LSLLLFFALLTHTTRRSAASHARHQPIYTFKRVISSSFFLCLHAVFFGYLNT
jgi:hypothetical protein